jgi:sugar lactone lactonase YvrE
LLQEKVFPEGMEGPSIDKAGNLYAVSFGRRGTIGIVNIEQAKATLFLNLPEGSTGNGIRFGKDGMMYVADYTNHNILKINPSTKEISVFAHNDKMNQPNDLSISSVTGFIYLSDPDWTNNKGNLWISRGEGRITLLESNMGTTNGVEVSPDGKRLFVNESNQRQVIAYDILQDGSIANKRVIHTFSDFGMDGMRCDSKGNLYISRYGDGKIIKMSPEGVILKSYLLKGKNCTNVTLSNDEKRAYVTMQERGCFEVIDL